MNKQLFLSNEIFKFHLIITVIRRIGPKAGQLLDVDKFMAGVTTIEDSWVASKELKSKYRLFVKPYRSSDRFN